MTWTGGVAAPSRGQQPRRLLLHGGGVPGPAAPAQQHRGLGEGLRAVQQRAHLLEVGGHLPERVAVAGSERAGVGGARGHQLAVDLGGQLGQAVGHGPGAAEPGQTVQRAGCPDQVADLLAEGRRRLELVTCGGQVTGRRRRPRPCLPQVSLVQQHHRQAHGVVRGQRLGRLAALAGQREGLRGVHVGPPGREWPAEPRNSAQDSLARRNALCTRPSSRCSTAVQPVT